MTDVPTLDKELLSELAVASGGERWEDDGISILQNNVIDVWDYHATYETIFAMDAYPGRFFKLGSERAHTIGDHDNDGYVTEVFPHQVTVTEYRDAR